MSGSKGRRSQLVADKRTPARSTKARKSKAPRRRSRRAPKRRSLIGRLFSWLFGLIWGIGWRVTVLAIVVVGGSVLYFAAGLPPVSALLDGRAKGSVTLLDREGEIFAWRGEQFGGQITAATVSPYLKNAIIATEDKRFQYHPGIDPIGIASAIRINLREGRGPLSGHGGSTLTQQTAKLLCLGVPYDPNTGMTEAEYEADCREGTLVRKAKEAVYALAMELRAPNEP